MKKNLSLLVAVSLPIIIILLVLFNAFFSNYHFKPRYNFLFTLNHSVYRCYQVVDRKLLMKCPLNNQNVNTHLYLYDINKGQASSISYTEAQHFHLDPNPKSPDGYTVKKGYEDTFHFLLGGGKVEQPYIENPETSKKIQLPLNETAWLFEFLGWIIE